MVKLYVYAPVIFKNVSRDLKIPKMVVKTKKLSRKVQFTSETLSCRVFSFLRVIFIFNFVFWPFGNCR